MPDLYGRNACVSELAIRKAINGRFQEGWRPSVEFEVPGATDVKRPRRDNDIVLPDTSETSTASDVARAKEDISDLRN